MKGYLWEDLAGVTDNCHSSGGVLVITEGDPIEALVKRLDYTTPGWDKEGRHVAFFENLEPPMSQLPPDIEGVIYLGDMPEATECVYIFPDAGCC